MIIPDSSNDPKSELEKWLGKPEDLIGYLVVALIGYGGVKVIQTILPGTRRTGGRLVVVQEQGPGGVQVSEP